MLFFLFAFRGGWLAHRQISASLSSLKVRTFVIAYRPSLFVTTEGPRRFTICGESGGTSCFYDLAERYRLCNLVAEREVPPVTRPMRSVAFMRRISMRGSFFVHYVRIVSEQRLLEPPAPVVWLSLQSLHHKGSVPTLWHTSSIFLSASAKQTRILLYFLSLQCIGVISRKNIYIFVTDKLLRRIRRIDIFRRCSSRFVCCINSLQNNTIF